MNEKDTARQNWIDEEAGAQKCAEEARTAVIAASSARQEQQDADRVASQKAARAVSLAVVAQLAVENAKRAKEREKKAWEALLVFSSK